MRTNPPNRPLRAVLVLAAVLLVGAGSLSALARIFQIGAPVVLGLTTSNFYFAESEPVPSSEAQTPSSQDSFSRTAPAWLTNAMPGYSSGRGREMWYLSLNSAGDRKLRLDESGGAYGTTSNPYRAFRTADFASAPFQYGRGAVSAVAINAPSGSGIIPVTPKSAITSPSSVNGPAVWSATPVNGNWNTDANWSPASPNGPSGLAVFGATNNSTISLSALTEVADIVFGSTAGFYVITVPDPFHLTISGEGVTNNSSATQNFVAAGNPAGFNHATGEIDFFNSATAGNDRVNYTVAGGGDAGTIAFFDSSKSGTANFRASASPIAGALGGQIQFWDGSSADHAILTANGSTVGNPTAGRGHIEFFGNSDAGAATLIANSGIGTVADHTGGLIQFNGDSTGGTSRVEVFGNGSVSLFGHNPSFSGPSVTIGSLEGDGYVFLNSNLLGIGSNNASTTFSGIITGSDTGSTSGSVTKVGSGLLILNGANAYAGPTTVVAGELFLSPSGSLLSSSAIRIGDTSANSPSAQFTFGSTMGGITLANTLTAQASASGTEGTRTVLGLATNGNTNTWSGNVTLKTDLTVQSAAAGSTVATGQGILLFNGNSFNVGDNTLTMDSNLRGNNADTYAIQGIVRITAPILTALSTGGSVVKDGSGTLILESTNNAYTGLDSSALNANGTRIGGGILGIFGDHSLGLAPANSTNNVFFTTPGTNVNTDSIAPTLRADVDGIILAPTRDINIANNVTARFDSNGNNFTVAGNINGSGNLNKVGAGTLALTGANTYTGTTTVSMGTLNAAATNALGGTTGSITVNRGGTLLLSGDGNLNRVNNNTPIVLGSATGTGVATFQRGDASAPNEVVSEGTGASRNGVTLSNTPSTPGLGALSLQSNATFDFGSVGVGTFTFGAFTANMNTLTIMNWTSNASALSLVSGVDGTDDRLIFSGAPTDIGFINFNGTPAAFILLDTGFYEVVPIPEPSTWIGAALALGAIGWMQRKRFKRFRVIS